LKLKEKGTGQRYKTFYGRNSQARVFATNIYFHPNIIVAGKARSLPIEGSHTRDSTLVGSSLAGKYLTRVKVNGSGKYCSSLQFGTNYNCRNNIVQAPGVIFTTLHFFRIICRGPTSLSDCPWQANLAFCKVTSADGPHL
jgi:hypothetical protein